MEVCYKCGRSEREVKLLDAIDEKEAIKVCEECALLEDIPIIRRPSTSQLERMEKPYSVRERLKKMAGLQTSVSETPRIAQDMIYQIKKQKEKVDDKNFDKHLSYIRKINKPLNLVENFHWKIMMERKNRKLTRSQLANTLGESETAIKYLENKELPDDALRVINKIEQFFRISLRQVPTSESNFDLQKESQEQNITTPATILKLNREKLDKLTIADLVKIKKEKEKFLQQTKQSEKQELEVTGEEEEEDFEART